MFSSAKTKKIFFGILILAAILRFWALGAADMIDDEIYYTFRAIGYLDYVGAAEQTTPVDWFYPLPGWTHLSFHDHPPLIFLVQHLFFQLFGVSIFVSRLPLALAGLVSLWLVYLITKKLFTETIKEAEPKVEGEDDTLLGQKFRGYEKSKEILQSAFIKLLNYKRSQTLKENLNKAR